MRFGITGNTTKDGLWKPLADLTRWLHRKGIAFCLQEDLAIGLEARRLVDAAFCSEYAVDDLAAASDLLFSFGGDGTLLRAAHQANGTPLLGVNIGRLGFLTKVEVTELTTVLEGIERGDYGIEERMTLSIDVDGADLGDVPTWALNDVVVDKSGTTSMIQIEASVDGLHLNTYWCDGLVVATPTGSTAYALSVGGPILTPGTSTIVVAPIAPHTLTARPIVLPCDVELSLRVETRGHSYAFATDGVSTLLDGGGDLTVRIRRAEHVVRLITLPDRDYFSTIRDKLSWGQGGVF